MLNQYCVGLVLYIHTYSIYGIYRIQYTYYCNYTLHIYCIDNNPLPLISRTDLMF